MTDEECQARLDKLRKKNPILWISLIANGRTDVVARRLLMDPDEVDKVKRSTPMISHEEFLELRHYACRRRVEINQQLKERRAKKKAR